MPVKGGPCRCPFPGKWSPIPFLPPAFGKGPFQAEKNGVPGQEAVNPLQFGPGEAAREPCPDAEAGIVKLEKRRTPWWQTTPELTLTWLYNRGGW